MPKPRKKETIQCMYFRWLLGLRDTTYYADGRSNDVPLGRHSLAATNRDEALKNLSKLDLIKAIEHGRADKSLLDNSMQDGPTIVEGWQLYLDSVEGRRVLKGLSPETPARYRAVRDKFCGFCSTRNVTRCRQLNKALLTAYGVWLDEKGKAYATKCLEITTLLQLVKFLIEDGHLPPTMAIKMPMTKQTETDTYCYQRSEVEAILNHCRTSQQCQWMHGVLATLAFTGMRISELSSLRWNDLDFEHGMIVLKDERHSVARRKHGDVRQLKGRRSRSFPIPSELLPILLEMKRSSDGLVFHGPRQGRLKPDLVRLCLIRDVLSPLAERFPKSLGAATSFIDGRVHSFRHFFCSTCANAGVAEQTLMSWLGHRSSQMIRRYYHLHDAASRQAMQKVTFIGQSTN